MHVAMFSESRFLRAYRGLTAARNAPLPPPTLEKKNLTFTPFEASYIPFCDPPSSLRSTELALLGPNR
jgi:hypothetical protein